MKKSKKKRKIRYYKPNDPEAMESLRFRLISLIESTGGRLQTIADTMDVTRVTVWRWIQQFELVDHLDAVRTKNRPPQKPLTLAWHLRHNPRVGHKMLMDIIWRNDGIIEACAIEMRCSVRSVYNRIHKAGLMHYLDGARRAATNKRMIGMLEPLRQSVDPHPHLVPIDGGGE